MLKKIHEKLMSLSPHLKLEECSKIMYFDGEYRSLKNDAKIEIPFILDNINYSRLIFDDVLSITKLISIFDIEPSYASVTGNYELNDVLISLERKRTEQSRFFYGVDNDKLNSVFSRLFVSSASGTTGALFILLGAILLKNRHANDNRDLICYNTPNYCIPDAYAKLYNLKSEPIHGYEENGFLPSVDKIISDCLEKRPFACFLTYPTNPTQALWTKKQIMKLNELVRICHQNKIYLIADNIFQDLVWNNQIIPEIFLFTDDPQYICKVTSPSKDRPFACGLRIGYMVVHEELEPWIEKIKSLTDNSTSTIRQIWLAFDSIFRQAIIDGDLSLHHFKQIEDKYLFGYGAKKYTAADLFKIVNDNNLFTEYKKKLEFFYGYISDGMDNLYNWIKQSECFWAGNKPQYGNTILVKVKKEYYNKDENDFFLETLVNAHTSSLIGSCFGINTENVWFRIAVGGSSTEKIIEALNTLQTYLCKKSNLGRLNR